MPLPLTPTFRGALAAATRPLAGMWVSTGSPLVAEICAGAGLDWLLIDMEHGPNGLESVLAQLQAVAAYPVTQLVAGPRELALGLLPVPEYERDLRGPQRGRALLQRARAVPRLATHYAKRAAHYRSETILAAVVLWLRTDLQDTPQIDC